MTAEHYLQELNLELKTGLCQALDRANGPEGRRRRFLPRAQATGGFNPARIRERSRIRKFLEVFAVVAFVEAAILALIAD